MFGGWSVVGIVAVQMLFARCSRSTATEGNVTAAIAALHLTLYTALYALNIGSAVVFLWWSAFLVVASVATPFDATSRSSGWLFRLAWTFFPLLSSMQTAQRLLVVFGPIMGRFGIGGDTPLLDAGFGALVGVLTALCLVPVLAPMAHNSAARPASGTFTRIVALVCVALVVWASRGAFPYSEEAPRRIDLIHVHDADTNASQIVIGAPNPGTIDTVTHKMPGWIKGADCPYIGFTYKDMVGECYGGRVDPPDVPMPRVAVTSRPNTNSSLTSVTVEVTAPESAVFVLWFNGTLRTWSLTPDDLPVKQPKWTLHVASDGRYAVMRRGRSESLTFDVDFDALSIGESISFELVSSYYVNCALQKTLREQLPKWTEVWGKSNSPGPLYIRTRSAVTGA
eukprot:Opistho-2@10800